MRLKGIFIFLVMLAGPFSVRGADGGSDFSRANQLYEKGDYKGAIAAYQQLISRNTNSISAHLLYNLGNAYFKNSQPGFAIANYRRAAALDPRDPDIQANLRYARDSITTTYQEPPYHRLLTWFRVNEVTVVVLVLWWALLLSHTLKVIIPETYSAPVSPGEGGLAPAKKLRVSPGLVRTLLVMFLVSASFLFAEYHYQQKLTAVILRETPVRFGPLEESQTAFTLREGAEMPVVLKRESWVQIGDPSRQGWVQAKSVILTR